MLNPDRPFVFGKEFFMLHQKILLWLLNTPIVSLWFRWVLRIHGKRSSVGKQKITRIVPNAIFWEIDDKKKVEFRSHNKYSKRLFYAFYPLWLVFHIWDTLFANKWNPALNLGFDTLTVYPDADPETTTVDGSMYRAGVNETLAVIRAGSATLVLPSTTVENIVGLHASSTTNQYSDLERSLFLFDTSTLASIANIESALFSFWATSKSNGLGSFVTYLCSSNPASNTNIVNADFSTLGTTSYGTIDYASVTTGAYSGLSLNSSGMSAINKGGITKLGLKLDWDILNSFTGTWVSTEVSRIIAYFADQTGTTNDPKLVVTYSGVSASPSVSPSASQSPSSSVSPSSSASASLSPSASVSPSISPSASVSPSASASATPSPSSSISPSFSPSPSPGYSDSSRGDYVSLPASTDDLENLYTEDEEIAIQKVNSNYVGQTGAMQYIVHQFKRYLTTETKCLLKWRGKSTLPPSLSPVYLQVFNCQTLLWETVDSNSVVTDEAAFYLEKEIVDVTNYKDDHGVITCRVYQLAI